MMRLSTLLKFLLGLAVAALIVRYGPWFGYSLMERSGASAAMRVAAIAVAVLSFVPLLALIGWAIGKADEYARHIFLLGIAFATAGSMLAFVAFDFMRDTHMVSTSAPTPWLTIMIAMWALGTAIASAYYRYRR